MKNIFNFFKKPPSEADFRVQYFEAWHRVREDIERLLPALLQHFQKNWEDFSGSKNAFSEEEWRTALESCLWAVHFLKMVQEIEQRQLPTPWVSEILESVLKAMDESKKGCRIRYSRGMLQEYAESGRGYGSEDLKSYFGEWLWNANAKNEELEGERSVFLTIGEQLLKSESQMRWVI
jgi:hypothetical protein